MSTGARTEEQIQRDEDAALARGRAAFLSRHPAGVVWMRDNGEWKETRHEGRPEEKR